MEDVDTDCHQNQCFGKYTSDTIGKSFTAESSYDVEEHSYVLVRNASQAFVALFAEDVIYDVLSAAFDALGADDSKEDEEEDTDVVVYVRFAAAVVVTVVAAVLLIVGDSAAATVVAAVLVVVVLVVAAYVGLDHAAVSVSSVDSAYVEDQYSISESVDVGQELYVRVKLGISTEDVFVLQGRASSTRKDVFTRDILSSG